jgi:hypothetical protein
MILYPFEALMWPLLAIPDRELDFIFKKMFYWMSYIQYYGVPTATWIGPIIMLLAGIIDENQRFEGPYLAFLSGSIGFGITSLGFALYFFGGIEVWYDVYVV